MPKDGRDLEDFMPLLEFEGDCKERNVQSTAQDVMDQKKKNKKKNKEVNNKMCN